MPEHTKEWYLFVNSKGKCRNCGFTPNPDWDKPHCPACIYERKQCPKCERTYHNILYLMNHLADHDRVDLLDGRIRS